MHLDLRPPGEDDNLHTLYMALRRFLCFVLIVAAAAAGVAAQATTPALEPSIDLVLARAAVYIQRYEKGFAGVVAEETYDQIARQGGRFDQFGSIHHDAAKHRVFKSDLLLVRPEGAGGWVQFRDVFEVDGKAVRDRNDRLAKLFLDPSTTAAKQIDKIKQESARYNVGPIDRNINVPVLALQILKVENQPRFLFNHVEAAGADRTDGAWAIDYREVEGGTMIKTNGEADLPVHGRFWIEPATGRVLGTTLTAENQQLAGTIQVDYEEEATLGMLVPRTMHEIYRQFSDGAAMTGVATYANFRRFQVQVEEEIAPIKQQ